MEFSIPNTAKIHQVKIKAKLSLQNLPCINSLSFRKCLKHLYLFTDKRFCPVITQLCAFRADIIPFINLPYQSLKQPSFSRWKKIKTTSVILFIVLLGVPFHKFYDVVALLKVISSIMFIKSTLVRDLLDRYFVIENLQA